MIRDDQGVGPPDQKTRGSDPLIIPVENEDNKKNQGARPLDYILLLSAMKLYHIEINCNNHDDDGHDKCLNCP